MVYIQYSTHLHGKCDVHQCASIVNSSTLLRLFLFCLLPWQRSSPQPSDTCTWKITNAGNTLYIIGFISIYPFLQLFSFAGGIPTCIACQQTRFCIQFSFLTIACVCYNVKGGMEATKFGCAAAKIDGHDKTHACGSSSASGEMDDKLDGALPDLLNCEDVSTKRLQGIRFENLSLTVRNPFRGKNFSSQLLAQLLPFLCSVTNKIYTVASTKVTKK